MKKTLILLVAFLMGAILALIPSPALAYREKQDCNNHNRGLGASDGRACLTVGWRAQADGSGVRIEGIRLAISGYNAFEPGMALDGHWLFVAKHSGVRVWERTDSECNVWNVGSSDGPGPSREWDLEEKVPNANITYHYKARLNDWPDQEATLQVVIYG